MISVGIDVSKGKSTVCIMKPGGEVLSAPFEITHTKSELLDLINIIKSQNEEVRVVMQDCGKIKYCRLLNINHLHYVVHHLKNSDFRDFSQ